MSKKIKCYNCGRECAVTKCSCGAEDWNCECGCGSGHISQMCKPKEICAKRQVILTIHFEDDSTNTIKGNFLDNGGGVVIIDLELKDSINEKKLKQQLAEKDKKIEYLKRKWAITKDCLKRKDEELSYHDKMLSRQICEKIREWCEQNEFEVENADQSSDCVVYTYKKLFKKLDQIEKGEFNETKKK